MVRLLIDIGNTALKGACFSERELLRASRITLNSDEELEDGLLRLMANQPEVAFIGSVNGPHAPTEKFLKRAGIPFTYYKRGQALPIRNLYESPQTLGTDRIANAVAGNYLFPKQPVVIIDAGTCIKFDFVNKNNEYFGGSISPGIDMRFRALHEFTGRLPLVGKTDQYYLIGKNTTEAIQSGVINGALAEVKGVLEQYQMTHKDLKVIVTGGDHGLLDRNLKSSIHAEPWLTLKGLNEIYLHTDA